MNGNRKFQELTIRDNFMFGAVMLENPDDCRKLLEYVLGRRIDRVEVIAEKNIVYHPEYRGVRLDVYVKEKTSDGEADRHIDVEMQQVSSEIFKRSRYYHSQIDMEILGTGGPYEELPDTYVIFICDFDPVGLKKYRYTRHCTFEEDNTCEYKDGTHTVFLNTRGENDTEVPESLVKLLKYIGADRKNSELEYGDPLVSRLQESVRRIKSDREMGARYMNFQEIIRDEFKAGKREGKLEGIREGKLEGKLEGIREGKLEGIREGRIESILMLLSDRGNIPESLKARLAGISDEAVLRDLVRKAATVSGTEEFEKELDALNL